MPVTIGLTLLAFLPVVLLIVLPLVSNIRVAAAVTFVVTSIVYFTWQATPAWYGAVMISSLVATINILMIVFGAIFLFETMQASGYIQQINQSVSHIHPLREVRFFLVAIGLTAFFEGVAGFGTPGAIVPLLLISMGFNPLLSVAAVLLYDGLFAAFGAVGTPLLAGLKTPLGLSDGQTLQTAMYTAALLVPAGLIVHLSVVRMYTRQYGAIEGKRNVFMMPAVALAGLCAFASLLAEYATILSAIAMLTISVLAVTRGRPNIQLQAWWPYLALVALLLLPKIITPLNQLLGWQWQWTAIFDTGVTASFSPLKSPLGPFLLVALLFTKNKAHLTPGAITAGKKLAAVALLLFPIIAVAQCMLHSGFGKPSMVQVIAQTFSHAGQHGYIVLAPLLGIAGTFITGSTTLSNIVFGASQQHAAALLSLPVPLVLALQLAGASIGNAVCLFNIIAACSVANIPSPNNILLKNLVPLTVAGLATGLLALVWWWII